MKPYSSPHACDSQPWLPRAPLAQDRKLVCLEDRAARVQPGHVDGLICRVHGAGPLDITYVMSGVDIFMLFKIFVTFYNLFFD